MDLNLLAGMQVRLKIPVRPTELQGALPMAGGTTVTIGSNPPKQVTLESNLKGFALYDSDIGELVPVTESEISVIYKHKIALENEIWFFPATGEPPTVIRITSVPIHDHSSIVQGGPAYGTYFSDD